MNKLTIAKTHKHPWASSKYSTVSKQKHWPCELERCRAKASFFSSSSAFEYDYNLDQESYKPLFRIKILFVAYAISLFLEKDVAVKCTSVIRSLAGITVRFPVSFHNFRLQSLSGNFIDCPYADPINMTQMWRLLKLLTLQMKICMFVLNYLLLMGCQKMKGIRPLHLPPNNLAHTSLDLIEVGSHRILVF